MNEILPFLKKLISASGLSGHEAPIRELIAEQWGTLADEVSVSRLGSLHALKRGTLPEPRPSLLIAAHMDAIGLMVTSVVGEFRTSLRLAVSMPAFCPASWSSCTGAKSCPG